MTFIYLTKAKWKWSGLFLTNIYFPCIIFTIFSSILLNFTNSKFSKNFKVGFPNRAERRTAPSEILVSREFSREFFNFHFSFSISSHLSFTFNSRKRVKGIYFSLFTSRKKWKLSEFHSFFSRNKSEIRYGVWPDISLSSQIVFFLNPPLFVLLHFLNILMVPSETNSLL